MTIPGRVYFDQTPHKEKLAERYQAHRERVLAARSWPFGAPLARVLLDPGLIERQGTQILARALSGRRVIAFAGAGLTMPHGRMTWAQLLESLYDTLLHASEKEPVGRENWRHDAWLRLSGWLWPKGKETFRSKKYNYTITAELFDELWPGEREESRRLKTMAEQVAQDTGSCEARARQIIGQLFGFDDKPDVLKRDDVGPRETVEEYLQELQKWLQSAPHRGPAVNEFWERYQKTFVAFGDEGDSPISLLVNKLGIRRYLTTNYDHEIENALTAFDYPERRESLGDDVQPAQHGTVHSSVTLGPLTTAQAIRFAADGPRRHASVLRLHGTVKDPKSLIVTEPDYQGLYLDRHPTHDLVQNAINLAFGGNPILFVGSNVGEDDILRPLRQFMTGAVHQRDRQAVALLPAMGPVPEMVAQKMEIYLRYGVHAVHYGFHHESPNGASNGLIWGWLRVANDVLSEIEKRTNNFQLFEAGTGLNKAKLEIEDGRVNCLIVKEVYDEAEVRFVASEKPCLPVPSMPEGVKADPREAQALWSGLVEAVRSAERLGAGAPPEQPARLRVLAQELRSAMITFFLNARLRRIALEAESERGRAGRLPRPVLRQFKDYDAVVTSSAPSDPPSRERNKLIYHRHRVVTPPRMQGTGVDSICGVPRSVRDLAAYLNTQAHFCGYRGRRTLVVSSRRGAGKGNLFDSLGGKYLLTRLTDVLGGYDLDSQLPSPLILHFNLSFSDEVAGLAGQMATLIGHIFKREGDTSQPSESDDLLERMALALDALRDRRLLDRDPRRCLLMLGNAGVLFNERGEAKSGQVARLLQLMSAQRYREAPLDVLIFCEERQIPRQFRAFAVGESSAAEANGRADGAALTEPSLRLTVAQVRRRPSARYKALDSRSEDNVSEVNWRPSQRRFRRLNVKGTPGSKDTGIVFSVQQPEASEVWQDVCAARSPVSGNLPPEIASDAQNPEFRAAWKLLGRNRLAATMAFAFAQTAPSKCGSDEECQAVRQILRPLIGVVPDSSAERVIECVLDGWFQRHLQRMRLDSLRRTAFQQVGLISLAGSNSAEDAWKQLTQNSWKVLNEILWHLSVFSHPVELDVLVTCEAIRAGLVAMAREEGQEEFRAQHEQLRKEKREVYDERLKQVWKATPGSVWLRSRLGLILTRMVEWCLIFLIEPRPTEAADGQAELTSGGYRYTVHRQLQKHLLRQAGGRNVETVSWDQFTTTLYASQPDETPAFERATHQKLVRLIQSLSRYPCKPVVLESTSQALVRTIPERTLCIRAAYFAVRSTFSLGAIARSKGEASFDSETPRDMEQYARLVSWIIQAALDLEDAAHGAARNAGAAPVRAATADGTSTLDDGAVFFAGEIVWLYNEWGVIRLAQGKLAEAEEALALSEAAIGRLEPDDTGSMHVRVRLQAALVQIERGHSARARTMLQPIADRATGHEVPRLLAKFYIGLIEHIGGAYRAAETCYREAADGLQRVGRPRALAMVMLQQADLHRDLYPEDLARALTIAREAIAIAQRGGHEDVRVIATLIEVRLRIEANDPSKDGLFATLSFAERYAERMDMPRIACTVFDLRARLLHGQGETHMAAAQAGESLQVAGRYELKLMKARAVLTLANIYATRGDTEGASELIQFGRQLATSSDYFGCLKGFDELELRNGV